MEVQESFGGENKWTGKDEEEVQGRGGRVKADGKTCLKYSETREQEQLWTASETSANKRCEEATLARQDYIHRIVLWRVILFLPGRSQAILCQKRNKQMTFVSWVHPHSVSKLSVMNSQLRPLPPPTGQVGGSVWTLTCRVVFAACLFACLILH